MPVLLKNFFKNIYLFFLKSYKFSIILNYENIKLENINYFFYNKYLFNFKIKIYFCLLIGNFVTLDKILNSKLSSRLNFSITFDNISSYTLEIIKWLNEKNIPFSLCYNQNIKQKFTEKNKEINSYDIIQLKNNYKDITFINCVNNNPNLNTANTNDLCNDINKCDKFLEKSLNVKSNYIAVSDAYFDDYLCLTLCEVARITNKRAILWTDTRLNLDVGNTKNKIKQLCRFNFNKSFFVFFKQIFFSFFKQHFLDYITQKKKLTSLYNSKLVSNPDLIKIMSFEDLSRPIKDYSGNLDFFKNEYILNPYLNNGKHTFAELQNERVVSLAQNLIMPFNIFKEEKKVNIFSNYRSIKSLSKLALSVLINATKEYKLSISYKPSNMSEPLFMKLGWYKLQLKKFTYHLNNNNFKELNPKLIVTNKINNITELKSFNSSSLDTVELSLSYKLLEWRLENYFLVEPMYFYLEESHEKALVIAQYKKQEILLLDQRYTSNEILNDICEEIIKWSKKKRIHKLTAETSCIETQKIFKKVFNGSNVKNEFCYFSPYDDFKKLKNKIIKITPLSSDILLR